ncbi:PREDICTED: ER membrane protein complex subunit 1-like [Priapulus caudatus]|uniref:ER membrane protein complex subunit 1 n=1 Tax=Priapulus caudatus TaxID=37621 RepID=A0ABM1ET55_PRICU|nr:PREDICTED: ER membrane protein complex subunit 1-like [Priapulus caudatus]
MAASTCILNFVKCLIILFFVNVSLALYADQVGKFDWNQKLIGKVKYALFDHSTHSSKRIVVATEENVIAALNSKTGAILWRHVFEKTSVGIVHALYNVGNDVVTLTGGGNIIRSWNSATGVLHWESVASKSTATDNPQSLLMLEKKTLVVLTSDTVFAVGLATGKIKWTAEVPNKDTVVYKHFYTDLDNLYLIGTVEGSHVTIATISLETGKVKLQTQVPASWVLLSTTCKMLQSGRLICFEPRMKYLYSLQPPSGDQFVPTALSDVMGQLMVIKDVSFTDLHADSVGVQVAPDHHIVITVDASGQAKLVKDLPQVFGIDNLSGEVIWQKLIPGIVPFQQLGKETLPLFVLRTTAHFPHPPEYAVLGKHKATGNGLLDVFNPITGRCMTREVIQLNYRVQHVSQLAQHDADFVRPVIFVDTNKLIHVYPETATDVLMEAVAHNYLFSADADTGVVTGYRMSLTAEKGFTSEPVWSVILSKDTQRITNVVAKRQNEHVHSQGRVLGDRSVLYKYLNPNLVVFTTEGQDDQEKSYVTLYLIDVISGQVVFSANHQRAKGPVNIVHSENWVVYTYWNQRLRRHEVAALEMYEGRTQSNTTAFSSLAPPPTPIVERQAYILPYTVVAMTTTITEKGITNRHILLALADGGILDLPKALLDPRRPNTPTAEHREEGLIPYMPEIGAPKEMIINYNRSVFNIDAIYSAPAGLESTTLIFAYGLDLFCTRVWPSKMFDVLKDDFDYWLISVVLTALILSSIILQKMAARKQLHAAWK